MFARPERIVLIVITAWGRTGVFARPERIVLIVIIDDIRAVGGFAARVGGRTHRFALTTLGIDELQRWASMSYSAGHRCTTALDIDVL